MVFSELNANIVLKRLSKWQLLDKRLCIYLVLFNVICTYKNTSKVIWKSTTKCTIFFYLELNITLSITVTIYGNNIFLLELLMTRRGFQTRYVFHIHYTKSDQFTKRAK